VFYLSMDLELMTRMEHWGFVHKNGPKPPTPLWQIAQYLSERGFAVLRYDKRGVGANFTINQNVWGNVTVNDLIQDSKNALKVLIQQPEVDPKRISIIGHSEGTFIAPRVAIDNSTKIKNIILMGAMAQDARDLPLYQAVSLPLQYATQVLDKNHTGLVSIQQIANDPAEKEIQEKWVSLPTHSCNQGHSLHSLLLTRESTTVITHTLPGNNTHSPRTV
jgi:pimeloyl-ACP methyl ester carboxylesterase